MTDPSPPPRKLLGRSSLYRGKVRGRTLTFVLTATGHALLDRLMGRAGCSRSDYLEKLIREDAARRHLST